MCWRKYPSVVANYSWLKVVGDLHVLLSIVNGLVPLSVNVCAFLVFQDFCSVDNKINSCLSSICSARLCDFFGSKFMNLSPMFYFSLYSWIIWPIYCYYYYDILLLLLSSCNFHKYLQDNTCQNIPKFKVICIAQSIVMMCTSIIEAV